MARLAVRTSATLFSEITGEEAMRTSNCSRSGSREKGG